MQPRALINAFVLLSCLALYLGQADDIAAATASFTRQRTNAETKATRPSTQKHEQSLLRRLLPRQISVILENGRWLLLDWTRMTGGQCSEVQPNEGDETVLHERAEDEQRSKTTSSLLHSDYDEEVVEWVERLMNSLQVSREMSDEERHRSTHNHHNDIHSLPTRIG